MLYANFQSFGRKETPITVKFQETLNAIKSGGSFTMAVEVASIENFKEKITTSLVLPIGWKVIDKKNPEKTVGLSWVKYVITIDVPDFVPTGKYQIAFKVLANGVERKVKNQTIEVFNKKLYERVLGNTSFKRNSSDTLREINRKIIEQTIIKAPVVKDTTENTPKEITSTKDSLPAIYNVNFQEALLKLVPGKPFTIFVEVISNKNIQGNIESVLTLPEGWNILIKKTLGKNKGVNMLRYMYTLTLPSLTPSGSYNIGLKALINNQEVAKNIKGVEVIKVRGIEITPLNTPEYVKEGDTLRTEYLIQNLGNNTEKVSLKTGRGKIKITGDSIEVKSNESVTVVVEQIIPVTDQNSWNASSDIYVNLKDSIRAITSIVNIPVYSTKNKKSDPYLRFPLEVGVWYSGATLQQNRYVGGLQYDARGKGFLDFGSKHYLDFIIHGPNRFNLPAVGSYDQYSLSYSYKNQSTVTLGDYGLRFSNLLEYGRFGRGAKFDQEFKHLGFSVFYLHPRFFPNQRDSYGGRLSLKFNNLSRISADFYSKDITFENNNFTTNFYGISSRFENKGKSFLLETELAVGTGNGKVDYGGFNRLIFSIGRLQVNSNFMYAGKNFYGFFNNSWLAVNGFTYHLSRKINVGFSNNVTRINPSYDVTVINTSPYSSGNVAFLNYEHNTKSRFTLSYNNQEREDRGTVKSFHYKEDFARFSYNLNAPKFTLWFNSQYGTAQNLLAKPDSSVNRQSISNTIQPQFRVIPWLWLGGYFEHQRTSKFSDNNRLNDFYFYGGSARINMGKRLNANFMYRNSYAPDELIERRNFLDLGVTLDLDRHVFSIQGGRTFIPNYDNTDQNSLFFVAKYMLRIGVPVAKNRNLGSIRGQVLGLSEDIKKEGVLVRLGERKFLTDPSGNFYFNNLLPDKYYVTMERSTMGLGVVANIKIPMEIVVKADSTQQVTIPLTKTGEIKGKIDFVAIEQIGTVDIHKNKPLVLVKIVNNTESYVTQVNKNDEFSFKEIKPDKWKITAWIPGKQEQFNISNSEEVMVLGANQVKEIQLVVKPIVRKINFSQKSYNLSSKK
jgi:hypothetical protein